MNFTSRLAYLDFKFSAISGLYSGIVRNFAVYNKGISNLGGMSIITGGMPNYTKLTISPEHDMSYHISGYGNCYEEAYIRFIGESVERYAGAVGHVFQRDRLIQASRRELAARGYKVLPLEYLHGLSLDQLKTMHEMNNLYRTDRVTKEDEITWVGAYSIHDPEQEIYVPASAFFVGFAGEPIELPSFTTGTACHEDIYKAFINALIEYIQIDAFMLHWYSGLPKTTIDFSTFPDVLKEAIERSLGDNKDRYELLYVHYGDVAKVRIPVVGVFVMAKEKNVFPRIAFGVQAGLDPITTLYRGTQEALAVLEMSTYVPINSPEIIQRARDPNNLFFDLDSNVAYYSIGENEEKSREFIKRHLTGMMSYEEYVGIQDIPNAGATSKEQLYFLLSRIQKISEYGCFLDLTPDIPDPTMHVIRCCLPELMSMSFPGFPYVENPAYKEKGVNIEYYPHPLP